MTERSGDVLETLRKDREFTARTTLALEDTGGEPLDRLVGRPMELRQFLRIAIGLSAALG